MSGQQQSAQETVGERFVELYERVNGVLYYGGALADPQPNTPIETTQIADTPLTKRRYLYEGNRGYSHLTTLVSLECRDETHPLFTVTESWSTVPGPQDSEPTRITGFRGSESNGDYELSKGWTPGTMGVYLGHLGINGLGRRSSAIPSPSRQSGSIRAERHSLVEELSNHDRQILDIITDGIQINVYMAEQAIRGANLETIVAVLGRRTTARSAKQAA